MSLLPQLHRHAWMDEDIEAFREQARRFIANELVPHLDGWRRQGFIPREVWRPFGELGFLLPELPEEYGGAGASLAYQLVVQDELAQLLGCSRQRVNVELKSMEREGVIRMAQRGIIVRQREQLETIAQQET